MAIGCSPATNLAPDCTGQPVKEPPILTQEGITATGAFVDQPAFDGLCAGTPAVITPVINPAFPIKESFENPTFDTGNANWTLQGLAHLTATVPGEDTAAGTPGVGRLRLSNSGAFTNGAAIYNPTFSNADNTITEVNWASWGGTNPGGDGLMQFFSDGSCPPQSIPLGGGGGLGLGNIQCAFLAVVLDEFGGSGAPGGFNFNYLKIDARCAPGTGPLTNQILAIPLNPNTINNHTRLQEPKLKTAIVTEAGQTYISVWIDWTGTGNSYTNYINRYNVTAACGAVAPPTLRTGFSASSGGAFQSVHEFHGLSIRQGDLSDWRALSLTNTVAPPQCAFEMNLDACVQVTLDSTDATVVGNAPQFRYWLVNEATNTVLAKAEYTVDPTTDVGVPHQLCINYTVEAADLPNLRFYTGAAERDSYGNYGSTWTQASLNLSSKACPCPSCGSANVGFNNAELHGCVVNPVPTNGFLRFAVANSPCSPFVAFGVTANQPGTNVAGQCIVDNVLGLAPNTQYCFRLEVIGTDGVTVTDASDPCQFKTLVQLPQCDPATNITQTSATLNAHNTMDLNNPNLAYRFSWGTNPNGPFDHSSAPLIPSSTISPDVFSFDTGDTLQPGTQYCFVAELIEVNTQREIEPIPYQCGLTSVDPVNPSFSDGWVGDPNAVPPYTMSGSSPLPLLLFQNCSPNRVCAFGITMDPSTGADPRYGLIFQFIDSNGNLQSVNGFTSAGLYSPPLTPFDDGSIAPGTYFANINGTVVTVIFQGNDWKRMVEGPWGRTGDNSGASDDIFISFTPPVRDFSVLAQAPGATGTLSNSRMACSEPIGGEVCCFTTLPAAEWCGGYFDPNTCTFVQEGQGGYYNCNHGI